MWPQCQGTNVLHYLKKKKFSNVKRDKNRTCHEMLHGKVQEQQLSSIEFSPSLKKKRELLKTCVLNTPLFMAGRPLSRPTHWSVLRSLGRDKNITFAIMYFHDDAKNLKLIYFTKFKGKVNSLIRVSLTGEGCGKGPCWCWTKCKLFAIAKF